MKFNSLKLRCVALRLCRHGVYCSIHAVEQHWRLDSFEDTTKLFVIATEKLVQGSIPDRVVYRKLQRIYRHCNSTLPNLVCIQRWR